MDRDESYDDNSMNIELMLQVGCFKEGEIVLILVIQVDPYYGKSTLKVKCAMVSFKMVRYDSCFILCANKSYARLCSFSKSWARKWEWEIDANSQSWSCNVTQFVFIIDITGP